MDINTYNNYVLQKLSTMNNITILLGGGNVEYRLKDFDLTITYDDKYISTKIELPLSYYGDFNSIEMWKLLNKYVCGKVGRIVFDLSTTKFLTWNIDIIKEVYKLLIDCGRLIIDQSIHTKYMFTPELFEKYYTIINNNDKKIVLLTNYGYHSHGFIEDDTITKEYNIPSTLDIINHNARLFSNNGFSVKINNYDYPVPDHNTYSRNVTYLTCIKITPKN